MPLSPAFPDLAALDLFVSVVELGSVSQAARAHQIAQPSASSRIQTLERQLGLALLERSPTGSRPTTEGSIVAGWASTILRAADELAAGVTALKAQASGLLRISASFTVAEYLLPPWLEQFLRNRPGDSVALDVANSSTVLERLSAGAADIGFIESPAPLRAMGQQIVARDELLVVVGAHHRWATLDSVSLDTLAATAMVLREHGSGTREAFDEELLRHGYDAPTSALDLGSTSAVRRAVTTGMHPSVLSRLTVQDDLDAGSLVSIHVPGLSIHRHLRAVWPTAKKPAPLAQALLRQLPDLGAPVNRPS